MSTTPVVSHCWLTERKKNIPTSLITDNEEKKTSTGGLWNKHVFVFFLFFFYDDLLNSFKDADLIILSQLVKSEFHDMKESQTQLKIVCEQSSFSDLTTLTCYSVR